MRNTPRSIALDKPKNNCRDHKIYDYMKDWINDIIKLLNHTLKIEILLAQHFKNR